MRKTALITALLLTTNTFANELASFEQIKTAATQGKTLHIAIDFSQCRTLERTAAPAMNNIGVFTPQSVQVTKHALVTSFTHFTLNNPNYPDQPTQEFIKYRIDTRDIVTVTIQTLDATNYARLGQPIAVSCPLGNAAKIYTDT